MQAYLAIRNLNGRLLQLIPHDLETDDCEAATKLSLQTSGFGLGLVADDWSVGTFHWGPLTGFWECLQPGEEPVEDLGDEWAADMLRSLMS